jgi:hypothetical protein
MIKKIVILLVAVVSVGLLLTIVLGMIVTRVEKTNCNTPLCQFFSMKKPDKL